MFSLNSFSKSDGLVKIRLVFYSIAFVHLAVVAIKLLTVDFTSASDPRIWPLQFLRWKLITLWFNIIALFYYPISIYCEWISLTSKTTPNHVKKFNQLTNLCFTSILFPVTIDFSKYYLFSVHLSEYGISFLRYLGTRFQEAVWTNNLFFHTASYTLFWRLWAKDRELLAPRTVDELIPFWTQHSMHTVSMILTLIDLLIKPRKRPKNNSLGYFILLSFLSIYLTTCIIDFIRGVNIYPFIKFFSGFDAVVFVVYAFVENLFYYTGQWILIDIIWGRNVFLSQTKSVKKKC